MPPALVYFISSVALTAVVLLLTRVVTTLQYQYIIRVHLRDSHAKAEPSQPPQIPYTIPFLGNAIAFLAPYPGVFFNYLFSFHPRDIGCCTLLLGGRKGYILNSSVAVHALFRAKGPHRDQLNEEIFVKALSIELAEAKKFLSDPQEQERMNHEYLLKNDSVNELTTKFFQVFRDVLAKDMKAATGTGELRLYAWLRDRMFTASTEALMGKSLLETYPELCKDFFHFDSEFLSFFFGFPKWTMLPAHRRRARILRRLAEWNEKTYEESGGRPMDPDNNVSWEPLFGSRAMRSRHALYAELDLSLHTRAALDLGFIFGLSSNAIPAAGWMLLHILDPNGDKTLLGRVTSELESAKREDGMLDIARLVSSPLLLSILHEVLRLYVDVLVTRVLPTDLTLPVDEEGKRKLLLKKDGFIFAPSWPSHRDPLWATGAPVEQFHAERFLRVDPSTGKHSFSTSIASGKLFPFGGGRTICPGRVFAKQEVLAAVATALLSFDFDVLGYVDEQGRNTNKFPGLRKAYISSGTMCMSGDFRVRVRSKV